MGLAARVRDGRNKAAGRTAEASSEEQKPKTVQVEKGKRSNCRLDGLSLNPVKKRV